jgi:tRNA wybutosine-synthesizing protein 4
LVARNVAPLGLQLHGASDHIRAMPLGTDDLLSPSSKNLVANREPFLIKSALMRSTERPKSGGRRRFAASLPIRGSDRRKDLIGNFGGMGLDSRLSSYDVYVSRSSEEPFHHQAPLESPSGRMCHTSTDLGDLGVLLVGGRASPDNALVDCWLFHKWTNTWERVDDLPEPRYRHSTIAIGDSALVAGGKSDSRTIHNQFLIWNRRRGWLACVLKILYGGKLDDRYPVKFGAVFAIDDMALKKGHIRGILSGGISQDGLISEDLWLWSLDDLELNVRALPTSASDAL